MNRCPMKLALVEKSSSFSFSTKALLWPEEGVRGDEVAFSDENLAWKELTDGALL